MQVFVTGATGYIGTAVVEKLQAAGHDVSGLARSDESARLLKDRDVGVIKGSLSDSEVIEKASRSADAVIHLAIEYSARTPALDRSFLDAAFRAMQGRALPLIYTSGIWVYGETGTTPVDERSTLNPPAIVAWRPAHEQLVLQSNDVRGVVIRPGMVYGRQVGLVSGMRAAARERGRIEVVGTGANRWPLVHVEDLADLYVLALNAKAGSLYVASVGESVPVRELAAAAAHGAEVVFVPVEEARRQMGVIADALVLDQRMSAQKATDELGWRPSRPSALEELAGMP
jgi:nucleoside-diphosphate-sugar epimerase